RSVRAIAELVLQTLDTETVSRAVGAPAWQEETGEAALGLREHQERVRHRRRAEPLVPRDLVLAAGADRACTRGIGAHVGAALLLGHRHAADRTLLVDRGNHPRVVNVRREARLPLGRDVGLGAE